MVSAIIVLSLLARGAVRIINPTKVSNASHHDSKPTTATTSIVNPNPDPMQVNVLRRSLMQHQPRLFEQHFAEFAEAFFTSRPRHRHMNLHIPKAGGTSLCDYVKKYGNWTLFSGSNNCFLPETCPLWCCCLARRSRRCSTYQQESYSNVTFLLNENWMDAQLCPDQFVYSMILRDPIGRSMSHLNHFLKFMLRLPGQTNADLVGQRLQLVQSNYMTWSLAAEAMIQASSNDNEVTYPLEFRPTTHEHLQAALDQLERIDFLVDLSYLGVVTVNNRALSCNTAILTTMGIYKNWQDGLSSSRVPKSMREPRMKRTNIATQNYKKAYNRDEIAHANSLDVALYERALEIIALDCQFFGRLLEQYPERIAIVGR